MTASFHAALGLSDDYWGRLSERDRALYHRVRPMRTSGYRVDHHLARIEDQLATYDHDARSRGGTFELCPDFQRGHVWDAPKQAAFIENLLRAIAPTTIRFNCPTWLEQREVGDLDPNTLVCVDGLQRLTAMRAFMDGSLTVFDGLGAADLKGTAFDPARFRWQAEIFEFTWRKDLLQFYLDLNGGGVVHAPEELARVAAMRDQAAVPALGDSPGAPSSGLDAPPLRPSIEADVTPERAQRRAPKR